MAQSKPDKKTAERTDVTIESLEAVVRQLTEFRDAYAKAVVEMREQSIPAIPLKGVANLMYWMGRMNGAMQSLQSAIMEARLQTLMAASGKNDRLDKAENESAQIHKKAREGIKQAKKKKGNDA